MKKEKSEKVVSKQELIEDLQKIAKKYRKEFGEESGYITRDYYRKYGKYKENQINELFQNFTNAKNEALKEDDVEIDSIEFQKKIIQLEEKNKELEKEKKELLKRSIDEDDILTLYKRELLPLNIPKTIELEKVKDINEQEAILMLSDFHAAEKVILEEVNYANEYNLDIFTERLDRIFYYLLFYCEKNKITKLTLLFLGDLLSGEIHEELIRTNEKDIVDTLFYIQEYLIKKLLEIEKYFSKITCEFVVGNHSRFSKKPEYKTAAKLNWEYVLAKQLEASFKFLQKEEKISINISPSLYKVITVAGRTFLISHGTFMTGSGNGGFAGIPYYSLAMSSAKMYGVLEQIGYKNENHKPFQDILIAHLHTTAKVGMFNGGNLFINGSVIGTNEFSLNKIKSVAKIEQTLLIVEEGQINQEIILRGTK